MPVVAAPPAWIDEILWDRAAAHEVSYYVTEPIARCESGGYRADVIDLTTHGSSGELGIVQILPTWTAAGQRYGTIGGLFERDWGGDYGSVYAQIDFLSWAVAHGMRGHWHC